MSAPPQAAEKALPTYVCKRSTLSTPFTDDFQALDWEKAATVSLTDAVTGEATGVQTEVRALYDDTYLFVQFKCEDPYIWATIEDRDGPVWEEECVEIFLNPSGSKHQYFEINLNPLNTLFDACVLNRRTEQRQNESFEPLAQFDIAGVKTETKIEGDMHVDGGGKSWTAYYAIPHKALYGAANVPPQAGDIWRANFYRIDSPTSDQHDHYAWSQTGKVAFHLPWRFGFLRFE